MRWVVAGVLALLVVASGIAFAVERAKDHPAIATQPVQANPSAPLRTTTPVTSPKRTTKATGQQSVQQPVTPVSVSGPLNLAGCPPPYHPPGPPGPPPWHPAHLVPDSKLPKSQTAASWKSDLSPLRGKGMWVWLYDQTEGGNAAAIVGRAEQAGLRQLWVRVGSSKKGFYGAPELDALVGRAHQAGISVIGWGFPYLYDPMRDAKWTAEALAWRGPSGDRLDGFSADIEKATEGVALSARRVAVYLGAVRRSAGDRLVVATVYRPTDLNWTGDYPYRAMARYVDAFAPMVYWGCHDPRTTALESLKRLSSLRPVHLIGQAYNMASEGGRTAPPSAREISVFLEVGRRHGALGASFWDWQEINGAEWRALANYVWRAPVLGASAANRLTVSMSRFTV
jgi:hypothetical protein